MQIFKKSSIVLSEWFVVNYRESPTFRESNRLLEGLLLGKQKLDNSSNINIAIPARQP